LLDNLNDTHLTLRDGAPVLIRRLVAEDATLYPDFLSDVIAEDLRLRFFESIREINHDLLVKLINYDPDRAMAFIAVDEKSQKMLGVVRLHDDAGGGKRRICHSGALAAQGPRSRLAIDEAHDRIFKA
jgi:hypothetical protein